MTSARPIRPLSASQPAPAATATASNALALVETPANTDRTFAAPSVAVSASALTSAEALPGFGFSPESTQRPQPGDEVCRDGRSGPDAGLLLGGAVCDDGCGEVQCCEQCDRSDENAEAERNIDDEQDHRRRDHRDRARDRPRDEVEDPGGAIGVRGGDGEQFPRVHVGTDAAWTQECVGDLDAEPVSFPFHRCDDEACAETPGIGEGREQQRKGDKPGSHRSPITRRDGVRDDRSDRDRDERLEQLVQTAQHDCDGHASAVSPQRPPHQRVSARRLVLRVHRTSRFRRVHPRRRHRRGLFHRLKFQNF